MNRSDALPLIICFGDSLTAGYQSPSIEHPTGQETPYGAFLQESLHGCARVAVSGICGEVTGEMVMRFNESVLTHRPNYVIILGGTNDLGWNALPDAIMANLVKMYGRARYGGIQPIAVSVPSLRPHGEVFSEGRAWLRDHIQRRLLLNERIRQYCETHDIPFVDLFQATVEPGSHLLAEAYSNDGLHLTTEGYRCLAVLLLHDVFAPAFRLPLELPPQST